MAARGSCAVDDCDSAGPLAKGMCAAHYARDRRYGDPHHGGPLLRRNLSPEDVLLSRSEPLPWSGCIVWTGSVDHDGYGKAWHGGKPHYAHRLAWEVECGPIPDGMIVDHMCYERSCVNTEHMRLTTQANNARNRSGPNLDRALPRGVTQGRPGGRYSAKVGDEHLGTFDTEEEAALAAAERRAELYGDSAGRSYR